MFDLKDKRVLVIGLERRAVAACELLNRGGAHVMAVDPADTPELRTSAEALRSTGTEMLLGTSALPDTAFDLAVLSPGMPADSDLVRGAKARGLKLISELELGFQQSKCLGIAIGGTNGKSTTAELVERLLTSNHRKAVLCGDLSRPVCNVVEQSKNLDYLILQVDSSQLESMDLFRPAVAALLNLAPAHSQRYDSAGTYARAYAGLFRNQQAFDWAIVQSETLNQLRSFDVAVPSKTITFSATDPEADLHLDRGLLISRLPNWSGPLLDIDHCLIRGPHNAENLMAALAIGHVLRLPLESMTAPLKTFAAGPHRLQLVAELNGVQFIDDAKAANIDALHKALLAVRPGVAAEANVWLIAGGHDQDGEFHSLAPVLSRRVKRAFLFGNAGQKIRAAWSLFTPCTVSDSLVEAVAEAARNAVTGDVVLLSPACSSFDQFRNYQELGEIFCQAVKSIGRGEPVANPHMHGKKTP